MISRGLEISDLQQCYHALSQINYYRLSGYWHPFLDQKTERFATGIALSDILDIYNYDMNLRSSLFYHLSLIKIALRTLIGYELGKLHPFIYLEERYLNSRAKQPPKSKIAIEDTTYHQRWIKRYENALKLSHEQFVKHYKTYYDGKLPIWVAVEIMDWGLSSHLYSMSPIKAQIQIAQRLKVSHPQLETWLKSLNMLRNLAVHQARLYNRSFVIKPKLPKNTYWSSVNSNNLNKLYPLILIIDYIEQVLNINTNSYIGDIFLSHPGEENFLEENMCVPGNWKNCLRYTKPSME